MVNMSDDVNRYYKARVKWIEDEKTTRKARRVRDGLKEALYATQVCMMVFSDFLQVVVGKMEDAAARKKRADESCAKLASLIKEAESQLAINTDEEMKAFQEKSIRMMKKNYDNMANLHGDIVGLNAYLYTSYEEVLTQALIDIYRSSDGSIVYDIIDKLLQNIIGLTPPGWLINALRSLQEVVDRKQIAGAKADEYMLALESYAFGCAQWCFIGLVLREAFLNEDKDEPIPKEVLVSKAHKRFGLLYESIRA